MSDDPTRSDPKDADARASTARHDAAGSEARSEADRPDPRAPLVAVLMGSASDWDTMREADEVLGEFDVPHVCRVVSAHRTPDRLRDVATAAAEQGTEVIIAGAGGAAHLPGMLAAWTHLPVLGVPVRSRALAGTDSLLSIVQMPRGVPVGTLAIGGAGAANAALLAVRILALGRPELAERLKSYASAQAQASEASELPTTSYRP
ncbi:MAG: 5-(carboxyamino)imidazole ribonucleotide mutase [Trueperaceae bacterium]|nr:5-(carboxyamino)imidazole ribonucleotide mutase [Trueperaceae bacterium]